MKSIEEKYEQNAVLHRQSTVDGNYRQSNKAFRELVKIYKNLEADREYAGVFLTKMLKSPDEYVRTCAASHSLGLKINIKKAEEVLEEAAKLTKDPLLSFTYETTLKAWREQGFLRFYR